MAGVAADGDGGRGLRARLAGAGLPAAAVLLLLAAALYELAIALRALDIGDVPGDGAPGATPVLVAALLTLFVAGAWALSTSAGPPQASRLPGALLAPAAAAFLLARFYAFDPYYAPALRRMSDGGLVPGAWVYALLALALGVAVLTARKTAAGLALTAPLLLLVAVTALLEQAGH